MVSALQDVSFKLTRQAGAGGVARISLSHPLYRGSWPVGNGNVDLLNIGSLDLLGLDPDTDVDTKLAADVLAEWGIATPPEQLPILAVPCPLAILVATGRWRQLIVLTRWHKGLDMWARRRGAARRAGPIPGWPPADASVWEHIGEHEPPQQVGDTSSDMTLEKLDHLAIVFRRLMVASAADAQLLEDAGDALGLLDSWRGGLQSVFCPEASGSWSPVSRFKYDAATMLECIRLCNLFRSGPQSAAVAAAIMLILLLQLWLWRLMLSLLLRAVLELLLVLPVQVWTMSAVGDREAVFDIGGASIPRQAIGRCS